MNIYVNRNNQTLGPYNETQVSEMIQSGALNPVDLYSVEGSNWQPISEFVQTESVKVETSDSDLKQTRFHRFERLHLLKQKNEKNLFIASHQNRRSKASV